MLRSRRAVEDGDILVTNHTTDFTALVAREDVHAGLICLNMVQGLMRLDVQRRLSAYVLGQIGDSEPINEVLATPTTIYSNICAALKRDRIIS